MNYKQKMRKEYLSFWAELHILHAEMWRNTDMLVDIGKYSSGSRSAMQVICPKKEEI